MIHRTGHFTVWIACACCLLFAGKALAQTALYYADYEMTNERLHNGRTALNEMGVETTVLQSTSFATALAEGNYSVVVIESYSSSLQTEDITALINFIQDGGRAVVNYWNLNSSSPLQAALGVSVGEGQSYYSPLPITVWEAGHAAMAGVPGVFEPTSGDNYWTDNGDKLTLLSGSLALAGYTESPTTGEAAIVLANDGRTIVNGFLAGDFAESDMVALYKAQIMTVASIPEPSTYALLITGAGLLWLCGRRRRG